MTIACPQAIVVQDRHGPCKTVLVPVYAGQGMIMIGCCWSLTHLQTRLRLSFEQSARAQPAHFGQTCDKLADVFPELTVPRCLFPCDACLSLVDLRGS